MKKLIYADAFTLAITSSVPATWATGRLGDAKVSHLTSSAAYPSDANQGATHQFKVHVQGSALSELLIDLPEDVSIRKGIEVTNQSGEKIDAQVSLNDKKATLIFSEPVPVETTLLISMQGINTPDYDQTWQYLISGKMDGMNAEIPLCLAQIQTYR